MAEQHSSQAKIIKCILSNANGSKRQLLGGDMIVSFTVHESILSPILWQCNLIISDSAGLLNSFPIQGGENIEFEVKTTFDDAPIVYKFKVYKISGRLIKNKKQAYMLGLVSEEALINETLRVQSHLTGNPELLLPNF